MSMQFAFRGIGASIADEDLWTGASIVSMMESRDRLHPCVAGITRWMRVSVSEHIVLGYFHHAHVNARAKSDCHGNSHSQYRFDQPRQSPLP